MRKILKIATIAAMLFVALGAVVLVYANSQNSLTANGEQNLTDIQTFFESNNATMRCHGNRMSQERANGLQWTERLLQNATASTVQGTVVAEYKNMLILNTDAGQIRILLPEDWTVGNEIVSRTELFNGTFASSGQSVTIKVLESNLSSNTSVNISIMMGYEAINATTTHAYAVLPFNIQPTS